MRKVMLIVTVCLLGSIAVAATAANNTVAAKPKHATKDVMKKALKGPLVKKVISGGASAEEKLALLDMMVSLAENKPKKGDAASWEAKTNALINAAARAAVGREGAAAALTKAQNCKACHSKHK